MIASSRRVPMLCFHRLVLFLPVVALILLDGCALSTTAPAVPEPGVAIQGVVHGGQQPIVGSHIYLYAAGTLGYGGSSSSLLEATTAAPPTAGATTMDASGNYYVTTDSTGSFTITGDYSCTQGQQVYLYAVGGDPGSGTNSAVGLLAILGNCPAAGNFASATPTVFMNEVSTVAAAYSFAGFATDATDVSDDEGVAGNTTAAQAKAGMANAFAMAANLENLSTGVALSKTPSGNANVPQTTIYTVADILAGCINSTGPTSSGCAAIFDNVMSAGASGTVATDTATAAIYLARNPYPGAAQMTGLFGNTAPTSPFSPALSAQPNDFTLGLVVNSGGGLNEPNFLAVDSAGNVWVSNAGGASEFSVAGAPISPSTGYPNLGGSGIAIDPLGNVWTGGPYNGLSELSSTGALLSPTDGFTGGGLSGHSNQYGVAKVAIDASGNVWTSDSYNSLLSEFANNGNAKSGSAGYVGGGLSFPGTLAGDVNGNMWVVDTSFCSCISEFNSSGIPLSPSTGLMGGGLLGNSNPNDEDNPNGIAIDASGNIWVVGDNSGVGIVSKFASNGQAISPSTGYGGGGLSYPNGIAIDGAGDVWVTDNNGKGALSEFNNSGVAITPATGYTGSNQVDSGGSGQIAIDGSGNVWLINASFGTLTEYIGVSAPVVTPIAAGLANNKLGTRP